jgi:hypothetical protein
MIPKLGARARFPTPAPQTEAQVRDAAQQAAAGERRFCGLTPRRGHNLAVSTYDDCPERGALWPEPGAGVEARAHSTI